MYTLMIKTHNITGLKYLCKTVNSEPHKYMGSGKYWKKHLTKHGRNIKTEILLQTEEKEFFTKECLRYSQLFNIVESNDWANLIPENGLDGGTRHHNPYWLVGYHHSDDAKRKISKSSKGRVSTKHWLGKTHTDETKEKISLSKTGKKFSDEHKKNLSIAKTGIKLNLSEEVQIKHSQNMSSMLKYQYTCSICGRSGNSGQIARYHKQCMENKEWHKIPKQ